MQTEQFRSSLKEEFQNQRRRVESTFGGMSLEQLLWRPDEKTWGVGECLYHMWITNDTYLVKMSTVIRASGFTQPENQEFESNWMGRKFMKMVGPAGGENTPVPKPLIPDRDRIRAEIVRMCVDQFAAFEEFLIESKDTDLMKTKMASPVVSLLRLQLGDVFKALQLHNERHMNQAERIMRLSGFPAKSGTGSASVK